MLIRYCDLCKEEFNEDQHLLELSKFVENPATGKREIKPAMPAKELCALCKVALVSIIQDFSRRYAEFKMRPYIAWYESPIKSDPETLFVDCQNGKGTNENSPHPQA